MPSTATTRNRFEKQAAGENSNTWGTKVNTVLDMVDACLDGVEDIATAGASTTLTNADYTVDQAKNRVLNCTGTGGTIVIPNTEKAYLVRNASSGNVIISTGLGTTATIAAGVTDWVFSTGANVVHAQGSATTTSGTYAPTVHVQSNLAPTFSNLHYLRVGNTVTLGGKVDATISGLGETSYAIISTPVNSAFTADSQAAGYGRHSSRNDMFFVVKADSANRLKLQFYAGTTTASAFPYWFTATYQVI